MVTRNRLIRGLAALAGGAVLGIFALWVALARSSTFYIGPSSQAPTYLEPGDVRRIDGPWMEYPGGGGPYLLYQNLHPLPALFRWSTFQPTPFSGWDGPVGHVDPWGRFHATSPGMIYGTAAPRGAGHGSALTQFIVLPPLDSIAMRTSRDTVGVGDTLTASYTVISRGGTPLPLPTINRFEEIPDNDALISIADSGLHTAVWTQRLRAAHPGVVRLEIRLGHHGASRTIVVH